MRNAHYRGNLGSIVAAGVMLSLATLGACDSGRMVAGPSRNPDETRLENTLRLEKLARSIARLQNNHAFSTWLADQLRHSRYVEGRVFLQRSMRSTEGQRVLTTIGAAAVSGPSVSVARILSESEPIELYFPYPEDRAWAPGVPYNVAVPLGVGDRYALYSPAGSRIEVSKGFDPELPTLVLGASEIDFDDAASALVGGIRTGDVLARQTDLFASSTLADPGLGQKYYGDNCWYPWSATRGPQYVCLSLRGFLIHVIHDGGLAGFDELELQAQLQSAFTPNAASAGCVRYTGLSGGVTYTVPVSQRLYIDARLAAGSNGYYHDQAYDDDSNACVFTSADDLYGWDSSNVVTPTLDRTIKTPVGGAGDISLTFDKTIGNLRP